MNSIAKSLVALAALTGLAAAPGCQPAFPSTPSLQRLSVNITSTNLGSPESRIPISFTTPTILTVDIQALTPTGDVDTSFNGYVRASVTPGSVLSVSGPNTDGRNALLHNGTATGIEIAVLESYGNTRIWVEDVGYVPGDPLGATPPQCSNGKDDNQNGKVDFPVDPGCYAANDDTEDGGTYAAAVSDDIYFEYPRIADVRGVSTGGSGTPFPYQQVQMNTLSGFTPTKGGVVVTGVGSAGFFVTDLTDPRGYTSVYAYTYTAPPVMLPCDRLLSFGGTSADFYGFTEINYPTWSLEEWDPTVRPCLVPDPAVLTPMQLTLSSTGENMPANFLSLEAALVRVAKEGKTTVHIGKLFGETLVPKVGGAYVPNADATDCDFNGDGKITFTPAGPESECADACQVNPECSEYSAYLTNASFRLVVTDGTTTGAILANGSVDATFDPVASKGQEIGSFSGNLEYFSGGSQFTITARCADDIVTDPAKPPLPPSKACVVARNAADLTNAN